MIMPARYTATACINNCNDELIAIKLPRCCGNTTDDVIACVGTKRPFEKTKNIAAVPNTITRLLVHMLVISHIGKVDNSANTTKTGYFPLRSASLPTCGDVKRVNAPPTA